MNHWRIATIGILALGATSLVSALTTAYLLRPPAAPPPLVATGPPAVTAAEHRPPVVHPAPFYPAVERRTARTTRVAAPVTPSEPVVVPQAALPQPAMTPPVPAVATSRPEPAVAAPAALTRAAPAADCDARGRTARIAKPGVFGALTGAALGAAGGAITDGGKGAGKGAALGGLAGAVLGSGYGAYKTHNDCGTVFGSRDDTPSGPAGSSTVGAAHARTTPWPSPVDPTQAGLTSSGSSNIHIDDAR